MARAALGDDDETTIMFTFELGRVLAQDFATRVDAEALLRQAFETSHRVRGDSDAYTVRPRRAHV